MTETSILRGNGYSSFALALVGAALVSLTMGCASADTDEAAPAPGAVGEAAPAGTTDPAEPANTGAEAGEVPGETTAAGEQQPGLPGQAPADATAAGDPMEAAEVGSDGEILAVLHVANQAEVATSQLAVQKSMAPEVREYAQEMIDSHAEANQRVEQTAAVTPPAPSERATAIAEEANATIERLAAQSGEEFDRSYVESQLEMHREVLDTIDRELLPRADNPDVRGLLQSMREDVQAHLEQAQELQQRIAAAG